MANLLLTSNDVHVSSKQLQALSSPHQLTTSPPYPSSQASRSNQPTDSGGFLLANTGFGLGNEKSDLDSTETNLTGVGRGAIMMEAPSADEPSLYTFLFDIFGESLGLRLSGHEALRKKKESSISAAQQVSESHSQQHPPSSKDIRHVNKAVVQFLSREGFKPIKADLPYSRPPQGHGYGEWRSWNFHIPRCLVPMKQNILEQGMRMGHGHKQQQQRHAAYRGRVKTGVSISYKRRSHKLRHSSDIGSSWL